MKKNIFVEVRNIRFKDAKRSSNSVFYSQFRVLLRSDPGLGLFKINADISEEKKEELIKMAQKYSPVFKSLVKPVPVSVELDREKDKLVA